MRDPVLLQVLQAVAELQEEEAHAALVNLRLSFVERLPLPSEVGRRLLGDLRGDDHHSLSVYLLARRGCGRLRRRRSRGGARGHFLRGQHALGNTRDEVSAVLLEVEVGGHGLLHRQTVEMTLFGLHGRTLTDLWRYKHRREREGGMRGRRKGARGGGREEFHTERDGKGGEPRNTRKKGLLVEVQGQHQFSPCSTSSEITVLHSLKIQSEFSTEKLF